MDNFCKWKQQKSLQLYCRPATYLFRKVKGKVESSRCSPILAEVGEGWSQRRRQQKMRGLFLFIHPHLLSLPHVFSLLLSCSKSRGDAAGRGIEPRATVYHLQPYRVTFWIRLTPRYSCNRKYCNYICTRIYIYIFATRKLFLI